MRKSILIFLFLAILYKFSVVFSPALAQNKAGINIGTKYSDLEQAINIVGPGGWIVVAAGGTGDCNNLQEILKKTNKANVNLIIRGHLNNYLKPADALGWVATLGSLKTSKMIYFMPWNEPNQEGSADYGAPSDVVTYSLALKKELEKSGVKSKVFLLSPMINQSHPNFSSYITQLGKGAFFSQFDGIAMNLYDFGEEDCGVPLCSSNPHRNPKKLNEVLIEMGVGGKPAFGIEAGTAGKNFYWKTPPDLNSPLYRFVEKFLTEGNPQMFALPSYDLGGEVAHNWSLFRPSNVTNLLSATPKGQAISASFDEAGFKNWLEQLLAKGDLVECQNSCGYAPKENPGLCSASGAGGAIVFTPFTPTRKISSNDWTISRADPTTLFEHTSVSYSGPLAGEQKKKYNYGGHFSIKNLEIPAVREIALFLAGPFLYQGNTKINEAIQEGRVEKYGPLANLTPKNLQDEMRWEYQRRCSQPVCPTPEMGNEVLCSVLNIKPDCQACPSEESNECLVADGTPIHQIIPPPNPKDSKYKNNPRLYQEEYKAWATNKINLHRWIQIPLISNPLTEVSPGYSFQGCDKLNWGWPPKGFATIRVPWVSALRDVAQKLYQMLTPAQTTSSFSSHSPKTKKSRSLLAAAFPLQQSPAQKNEFLAQVSPSPYPNLTLTLTAGPPTGNAYKINWQFCTNVGAGGCGVSDFQTFISGSNGQSFPTIFPSLGWGNNTDGRCLSAGDAGTAPFTVQGSPGQKFSATFKIDYGNAYGGNHCSKTAAITCETTLLSNGISPASCTLSSPVSPPAKCPPDPPESLADGSSDPVETTPHVYAGASGTVACTPQLNPSSGNYECSATAEEKEDYWTLIRFPFLQTIHNFLAGEKGIFRAIFAPKGEATKQWGWAGRSPITYGFCDSTQSTPKGYLEGQEKNIQQTTSNTPGWGVCDQWTEVSGKNAYPEKIGGTWKAKEWVIQTLNPSQ